jgi:hypothetical protein
LLERQRGGEIVVAYVRKKRVGPYEYHQLVESRSVTGKPCQRVLLHLGRYPTVEAALEGWPKEVEGLRRFAGQRREMADQLEKERLLEPTVKATIERAQKAENLAGDIATKLNKLQGLREQGKV